ncbi:hypothetical protein FRX31_010601 [Thalictrum thalictroides]|uniref:Uncharacterized protein n=1 Tax=Thalictrum thalictroides TaxID=46969 RepID=A0A7J6WT52_THATH|nr:hypothetical protein FRX31_010601 [Thalictrum thalictroides]
MKTLETNLKNNDIRFAEITDKQDEFKGRQEEFQGELDEIRSLVLEMKSNLVSLTKNVETILKFQEKEVNQNNPTASVHLEANGKEAENSNYRNGILGPPPGIHNKNHQDRHNAMGRFPDLVNEHPNSQFSSVYGNFKIPKLDFPQFNGEEVRGWIQKANRYFLFNPIDSGQMVLFASLHLQGRANTWFQARVESLKSSNGKSSQK